MKKKLFLSIISFVCAVALIACGEKKNDSNVAAVVAAPVQVNVDPQAGVPAQASIPAQASVYAQPYAQANVYNQFAAPVKTEYLKVLPANAIVIMKVNVNNLLNKSEVLNHMLVNAAFANAIKDFPEDTKSLLRSVYNNPSASGISVASPIYLACVNVEPNEVVVTIAIDDIRAFENLLFNFVDRNHVYSRGNMKSVYMDDNEVELVYDSEKIVIVYSENYPNVSAYTNLYPSEMAVNNANLASFFSGYDDAKIVFNLSPIFNTMLREGEIPADMKPYVGMFKDYSVFGSLNFEHGYVDFKINTNMPAQYTELFNKYMRTPTKRHFKYIPANSIAVMSNNLDLMLLYPILESTGVIREIYNNTGIDAQTTKLLLQALSGDYTAAMWVNDNNLEDVQFMAAIDCSDRTLFDLLIAYGSYEMNIRQVATDVYALNVNMEEQYNYYTYEYEYVKNGYDYYLMYKDGAIMVMPENLYNRMAYGNQLLPLSNSALNNPLFAYMTEEFVVDVKPIRDILSTHVNTNYYADDDERMALEVLNIIKSLTLDYINGEVDLRVNLNDASYNSLKVIVDKIISLALQNAGRSHNYYN